MAVERGASLVMGRLFDAKGISILAIATGISALFVPLSSFLAVFIQRWLEWSSGGLAWALKSRS